jgi:transcription initiation factor IIF auxiliary subunit
MVQSSHFNRWTTPRPVVTGDSATKRSKVNHDIGRYIEQYVISVPFDEFHHSNKSSSSSSSSAAAAEQSSSNNNDDDNKGKANKKANSKKEKQANKQTPKINN